MIKHTMRINWKIRIGFCLTLMAASSCADNAKQTRLGLQDTIPVTLLPLTEGTLSGIIHASGTFTTDDETVLAFKMGGVLQSIAVDEGDRVTKGQALARLNPVEIDAGVQQALLAHEKAVRDYERAVVLYKDSVATREQLENARTARDVAKQQLDAVRFNQNQTEIRAPLSGYVLKRFVNRGQVVGPGTPILVVNGAAKADWFVKVSVSDSQWTSIQVGDSATVNSDILKGATVDARVYKKSEGIDAASGMFTITLKVDTKPNQALATGAFAQVTITPSKKHNGWSIPYDALLEGDRGNGYVFISNDTKTAQKVDVQIAEIRPDRVLIKSGLENAKYLILSGSAYLDDGSKIKVIEP